VSVEGWREVKLGEVCEINANSYSQKDNWSFINYLDTGNITENNIDIIQYLDTNVDKIPSRAKRKVLKNDILFSTVRPNQKHYGIIKKPFENMLASTGFAVINGKKNELENMFLFYFLTQQHIVDSLHTIGEHSTSAYPAIKPSDIECLNFSLPPLPEQKAIAATLSCLDDKIELNNRLNKNLEEMAQAIFKSWFVDFEPFQDGEFEESELGMIPKGWRVVELGDIATFIKGKKPKALEMKPCDAVATPYLTIDVLNGGLPQYAESEKMVLAEKLDILMVMDGASSGTVYYGLDGIVASTLAKYKVGNEELSEIVYQYLKFYEDDIKRHNTGSAIPHTDKGFVSKIKVLIPDDESKKTVTEIFKRIRCLVLENRYQCQKLKESRDTLLPKLMSGEVRVPLEEV